ncbi:hypothetical protein GQ607_016424 [Colletotrichum asianum]|uniref:Ubiquitin-like domain-containing protein n=1 Tax=Colletotrichum asianum TaxID=702518 RepID=A0A8H3VWP0_9PEZI|nr:hypothetical protein GQ607_016424 [Colletotrichum asianum]
MEFTLAFGAVGDFIAVIALIKDIITALDDSRGSAKDYRDIVHSLEILQRTVEQYAAGRHNDSPEERNHEARITQATENEDRIAITIRRSSQMLKQYVGAIGQRILSKLDFMTGLSLDLRKSSSDLMAMMVSLSGELSGIKNILMRLERPLNDEHFILEDITGRVFPIHLKTITSWEAFEFILADRFRGKRGAHRVKGKQYSLQERATHRQIDRAIDWEGAFLPYQRIDMSLLCREAQGGSPKRSCLQSDVNSERLR